MKRLFSFCTMGAVIFLFSAIALVPNALANNITVSNVSTQNQSYPAGTIEVKFDLTWENTYSGTDANAQTFYDRAWVFVKYTVGTPNETDGWSHATLASGGTVTPEADGKGAIVNIGTNQTLKWYYAADGVAANATINVRVLAMEIVLIPTGQFIYNKDNQGGSTYNNFSGGSEVTVDQTSDVPSGASDGWPNGYSGFWIAKYETSQGQYSDFLNMLPDGEAGNRFGSYTDYEHTITDTPANPYGSRYSAAKINRSCARISWADATAYASWSAMRPMTEMEFEKAARGGGTTDYDYPWGNTDPATGNSTYQPADHSGNYDAWRYYANHYDGGNNADTYDGPTNVGNYLSGDLARTDEQTGASPYGVTDMAGNVWEHLINCAHTTTPTNGDGTTTVPSSWPEAAAGKGLRGGSWGDSSNYLRVSDRGFAAWSCTYRYNFVGFRLLRAQ